jgi:glutamyl-tRNA reductase
VPVVLLGLSHKTAPAAVRDRHTLPAARIAEALAALRDYEAVLEAAVLSTCNRLEIYADVNDFEAGIAQLKEFLTTYRNMRVDDFDKYLYTMLGAEAVEQLFRVASGLDSMLIGEPEIVAQVKGALHIAEQAGCMGPNLGRLFRMALQTGKRARTDTAIGRDLVSLGAAAVELAQRHCDLASARCTVIGAGKMGAIVAKHLRARSAQSICIVNRTLHRAQAVAAAVNGCAAALGSLPDVLLDTDVVISAVGRGTPLIDAGMLRAVVAHRRTPLLIVDIGVPRDVEQAEPTPEVALFSLEDLREIVDQTLHGRRAEIPAVEAIISRQVQAYTHWYRSRGAAPLIASLRSKAEEIRDAEIQRLFARMPELDQRQRDLVKSASVSIINKLLHAPVTKLREAVGVDQPVDEDQLLRAMLDLDVFSDRLQRQLDAHTAPFFERSKKP